MPSWSSRGKCMPKMGSMDGVKGQMILVMGIISKGVA